MATETIESLKEDLNQMDVELCAIKYQLEMLAETMHLHADGLSCHDGEDWVAEREMLFLFIDKMRLIIRNQNKGTPRLNTMLGKAAHHA